MHTTNVEPTHAHNSQWDPASTSSVAEQQIPVALRASAIREIRSWDGYAPTPLIVLEGLARSAGVKKVWLKDEGARFGVGSFKALGGAYAVQRLCRPGATFACATDGNHGRAVAWGARRLGCRCIIYLHAGVSAGREAALRALGAEIVRVSGNYDDSTRAVAATAAVEGWILVGDTSDNETDEAPRAAMAGYTLLVEEVAAQLSSQAGPTHIFVQAGVGGLAAAVIAASAWLWRDAPPRVVTVEPARAACIQRSIDAGCRVRITGSLETVMAGLSCGEVSAVAWPVLRVGVADALAVPDTDVGSLMRAMFTGAFGDVSCTCGESGVAGTLGLQAVTSGALLRDCINLHPESRVLLINTEGATDPEIFASLVPEFATRGGPMPLRPRVDCSDSPSN